MMTEREDPGGETPEADLVGTAPPAHRAWLLVEHNGPWPAFDLPPDLPEGLAGLLAAAPAHGVRPQLIRRPLGRRPARQGGANAAGGRRSVPAAGCRTVLAAYADPHGTSRWLLRTRLAPDADLTALDLAALGRGTPPSAEGGWQSCDPVLLVCAHGRREPGCARFGHPAAVALAGAHPEAVWETTHVGGDRYAGNLVALPAGTYHGRVTAANALEVAAACLRDEVVPASSRGRCGLDAREQTGEWQARTRGGLTALDDAVVAGRERPDGAAVAVRTPAGWWHWPADEAEQRGTDGAPRPGAGRADTRHHAECR